MKVLKITHEDGSIWEVPASIVARDRAEYYAQNDTKSTGGEAYDTTVEDEMEYALGNARVLRDWATNNMLWSELQPHAEQVEQTEWPPRKMATADLEVKVATHSE